MKCIESEIYSADFQSEIYSAETDDVKYFASKMSSTDTYALKYIESEIFNADIGEFEQTEYGPSDFVNISIIMQENQEDFLIYDSDGKLISNSLEHRIESLNISNIDEIDLDESIGSEVEVGNNVLNENVIYENLEPMENATDEIDTDSDFQLSDESIASTTSESDSDKRKKRKRKVSEKTQDVHAYSKENITKEKARYRKLDTIEKQKKAYSWTGIRI